MSGGTKSSNVPNASTPVGNPIVQGIEFATPPTRQSVDSEGVLLRFRTVSNNFDTIEEMTNFDYSGVCYLAAKDPRSVEAALKEQCWREAMVAEMDSIGANKTWEMTTLPPGHRAMGLKWVFKVKKDPEGHVTKHEARLVAKGYAQREGVDFEEVYVPVARIETEC